MAAAELFPVSIEIASPRTDALQDRIDPLIVRAGSLMIDSQESYASAADFLRDCKTMQADIRDTMDPAVKLAYEAHRKITGIRSKLLGPIEEAEKLVKRKMAGWVEEQERVAREERLRIEREARRAEEDRRLREAAELQAAGEAEAADDVLSAPITTPIVTQAPKPTAAGVGSKKVYRAVVTDPDALIRAAADGKVPPGLVEPNQKALDALARSLGEGMRIPGVEVRPETVISARGR